MKSTLEAPIIFSTDMVKAIQNGNKHQTRRILKVQPPEGYIFSSITSNGTLARFWLPDSPLEKGNGLLDIKLPYKRVGSTLWVRETWNILEDRGPNGIDYGYKANCKEDYEKDRLEGIRNGRSWWKWKASIHMPKKAARIFLKITDIRIEQLQDISEEDARAEGIREFTKDGSLCKYSHKDDFVWQTAPISAKEAFKELWDGINKNSGHGWESNTWVEVITFEKLSGFMVA